jgi:FlaG/FlaF family flagellin (archaellin)
MGSMKKTTPVLAFALAVAVVLVLAHHVPSFAALMRKIHGG